MKEQKEFFDTTPYVGAISDQMPRYRQFVMMHETEAALGISFSYWEHLAFGHNSTYFLHDVLTILRASERRTFKDWLTTFPYVGEDKNKSIPEWREYRQCVDAMNAEVNPIVEEYTITLLAKLLRTQYLDISGQSNSIPLHKK